MSIRIVPMEVRHLDEVEELERLCFSRPWTRAMLMEEMQNDDVAFLVAEQDEGIVCGYAGLQVVLDEGYILNVAVYPALRRRGIGTALMNVFLNFARERGLRFLTLEVRASNTEAILLYGRLGFRAVGTRPGYYEQPREDARIMTLTFGEDAE